MRAGLPKITTVLLAPGAILILGAKHGYSPASWTSAGLILILKWVVLISIRVKREVLNLPVRPLLPANCSGTCRTRLPSALEVKSTNSKELFLG